MAMTLGHAGTDHRILCFMDDLIRLSSIFEEHLKSLERTFAPSQATGLTLKPLKSVTAPHRSYTWVMSFLPMVFQYVKTALEL